MTPTDTTYKPLPILNKLRNTQYRLRSTDTVSLDSLDDVLDRYISHVRKGEDGLLALVLAREAVFWAAVMANCTPLGTKTKFALPQRELYTIKKQYSNVIQSAGQSRSILRIYGESAIRPSSRGAAGAIGERKRSKKLLPLYTTFTCHLYVHL